jgi:hypothetical protein
MRVKEFRIEGNPEGEYWGSRAEGGGRSRNEGEGWLVLRIECIEEY